MPLGLTKADFSCCVLFRSVRAVITTPAESRAAFLVRFTHDVGLPRYYGESASALAVSRPARCLLALRPARPLIPLQKPFLEVLQTIRFLLIRFKRFRLERELAGPDFHRREQHTLTRHTYARMVSEE